MSRTENFRNQHKEILNIAGELAALLQPELLAKDGHRVRKILTTLSGKLNIHLAMEDKVLYPKLVNHSDTKISSLARQYQEEMGGLSETFTRYIKKWATAISIQNNPAEFITETKTIYSALIKRIDREDNELYNLFDKIE